MDTVKCFIQFPPASDGILEAHIDQISELLQLVSVGLVICCIIELFELLGNQPELPGDDRIVRGSDLLPHYLTELDCLL